MKAFSFLTIFVLIIFVFLSGHVNAHPSLSSEDDANLNILRSEDEDDGLVIIDESIRSTFGLSPPIVQPYNDPESDIAESEMNGLIQFIEE